MVALGADENVKKSADDLYEKLTEKCVEVLYDDREVSAGAKLADVDLIGIPTRVIVSKKTLAENSVEVKERNEKEAEMVKLSEIIKKL